jgi:hypothetical protein
VKSPRNGLYAHRGQADRPLAANRVSKLLLPLPPISVLTGCRVLARAHPYAGARYIVFRGLGLGCSKRPTLSEYRDPMHSSAYGLLRTDLPRTRVYKGTGEEGPRQAVLNLSRPPRASISACFTCCPRRGIRKSSDVVCVRLEAGGSVQTRRRSLRRPSSRGRLLR